MNLCMYVCSSHCLLCSLVASDDVAWLAKVNHDAAQRREVSELDFATSACAQAALCPDPRGPRASAAGSAEMEVEAPYW
jgi:hypothetical protein